MLAFVGILCLGLLLLGLLDTEGRVTLTPSEEIEYAKLCHEPPPTDINLAPVMRSNEGLNAVAWEIRHHRCASDIAALARSWGGFQDTATSLFSLIGAILLLGFAYSAFAERVATFANRAAAQIAAQLRASLHRHALRIGTSDLLNREAGRISQLFTVEVEVIRAGLSRWIEGVAIWPARILVLAAVVLAIDWKLAFDCLVPLVACGLIMARDRRHTRDVEQVATARSATELELLEEGMHKSRLISGYRIEDFEQQRFRKHLARHDEHVAHIQRRKSRQKWLVRTLVLVCLGFVISLIALRLLSPTDDPGHLTLPESVLILACLVGAWRPIEGIATLRELRADVGTAIDGVTRFLNTIPEVGQAVGAKFLQPVQKTITFEAVTYQLGSRTLLDSLSLTLPTGSSTAIVSFDPLEALAFAAMLPRFIEPSEGKILFDGSDIAWATLDSIRIETLLVGEGESHLTGTVFENLSGCDAKYSLTQVTEAAKKTHAHNFIQKLPYGYETVIGKHGEKLDAGQTFRLALARAVLRDPAVLIIAEPDGEISNDDKSLIDDACRRVLRSSTVIFIPKRLPTLRHVDRIVLLNRGKVEVVGTHEVLVKTSAIYRHWEYIHFNEYRHETSADEK